MNSVLGADAPPLSISVDALGAPTPCALFADRLILVEFTQAVQAGFPSPAEDLGAQRVDLMSRLVRHPQATYLMKARGDSMRDAGIFDGSTLMVDKAVPPRHGHVVVAVVDGEFVCKTLWQRAGRLKLKAANPCFPDIIPKDGQIVEVWGVVVASILEMPQ